MLFGGGKRDDEGMSWMSLEIGNIEGEEGR
jgi:hypothetical protein